MRRTGSRESRESRDASVTSPTSIAVKTFSIRLGSRRNQRPPHQKIRSITTVKATIDTRRIGHMMGPPFRKLSMMKLLLQPLGSGVGPAVGLGLNVAVTVAPGTAALQDRRQPGPPVEFPVGLGAFRPGGVCQGAPGWGGHPGGLWVG